MCLCPGQVALVYTYSTALTVAGAGKFLNLSCFC
jgi:hypothetical protein